MAVKSYDAKAIIITVGGIIVQGYADGSFVTVTQNEDSFTHQKGSDGEGTRSRSNNESATVTLTLMQTSTTNAFLSALHNVDKAIPGRAGVVPFLMRDMLGSSICKAQDAWITKTPDIENAREAGTREWTLTLDSLDAFVGGNI